MKREVRKRNVVLALAAALSACSGHVTTGTTGANCTEDAHCGAGNVCVSKHCTASNDASASNNGGNGGADSRGGGTSNGGAASNGGISGGGGGPGGVGGAAGAGFGAGGGSAGGGAGAFTGTPGEIGDAFVPDDEGRTGFMGFSTNEVNISTRFDTCASGVGIVVHFQGRVGCPYGQPPDPNDPTHVDPAHQTCFTPSGEPVTVPVPPQYVGRPPADYVYCSCRCDGPLKGKEIYCACPDGFACESLVTAYGFGDADYAGSYCQKPATLPSQDAGAVCSRELVNCGPL